MNACLIHLNGAPGVGKLTIARDLARRMDARILDNHAIANVAFALTVFRSPEFYATVKAVRQVAYDRLLTLPATTTVILTDCCFADSEWGYDYWAAIETLAAARGGTFVPVTFLCTIEAHRQRIVGTDRAPRGKLDDPAEVERLNSRPLIHGEGPLALTLDVSPLSSDEAADRISAWIAARIPREG